MATTRELKSWEFLADGMVKVNYYDKSFFAGISGIKSQIITRQQFNFLFGPKAKLRKLPKSKI